MNRLNLKRSNKKEATEEKEEEEEELEDEELDLICAYPEEETNNQKDSESVKDKLIKGVKFKDTDSQSIASARESIKSTHKFDDFGLEESEVISLEKFDDVFQNEISKSFFLKYKFRGNNCVIRIIIHNIIFKNNISTR